MVKPCLGRQPVRRWKRTSRSVWQSSIGDTGYGFPDITVTRNRKSRPLPVPQSDWTAVTHMNPAPGRYRQITPSSITTESASSTATRFYDTDGHHDVSHPGAYRPHRGISVRARYCGQFVYRCSGESGDCRAGRHDFCKSDPLDGGTARLVYGHRQCGRDELVWIAGPNWYPRRRYCGDALTHSLARQRTCCETDIRACHDRS